MKVKDTYIVIVEDKFEYRPYVLAEYDTYMEACTAGEDFYKDFGAKGSEWKVYKECTKPV